MRDPARAGAPRHRGRCAVTASWRRWQDGVAMAAGAFLALSPIWLRPSAALAWTFVALGVLIAGCAALALAFPESAFDESALVLLGILVFVLPWLASFADETATAWTAWAAGGVVTLAAL